MSFIIDYLPLLAGIGMFLFGMNILGDALEKIAGNNMEGFLQKLTSNRVKGAGLGVGVTGVIQSSSATIVIVVGLLNAGIVGLTQAVPVVMGANIGSTVTAWILSLGDLGNAAIALQLIKPKSFGPILMAVGAGILIFAKRNKVKNWGSICMGLGMIFFGMATMENTMSPLKQAEWFTGLFQLLSNPVLGIIMGFAMTVVLQSSSASVGILQALSATGAINFASAMPIILGMNVGKCVPVIIASIGSKKPAKRAILLDCLVNTGGMLLFCGIMYGGQAIFHFAFWDSTCSAVTIAIFHSIFNIVTTLCALPFVTQLCKFATKVIKDDVNAKDKSMELLDDLLIKTPSIALQQARKVAITMGDTALESYRYAVSLHTKYDQETLKRVLAAEDYLDRAEKALNKYILRITPNSMSSAESRMASELLHTIGDFERIGDHAVNISEVATYNAENKISFTDMGLDELEIMFTAVDETIEKTLDIYKNDRYDQVATIDPLETVTDDLQIVMRDRHVDRLQHGQCSVESGISFVELITDLERIADHCSNVGNNMLQTKSDHYLKQHQMTFAEQKARLGEKAYADARYRYRLPEQNLPSLTEDSDPA